MSNGWTPLDGIRGILALAVLGIHIPLKNEFTRHIKKGIGVIIEPVDVFLLLSGLACGRGYANKPWSIRAIVLFYQRRLRRILPVYLFAISIMRIFDHQTNVSKYLSPVEYLYLVIGSKYSDYVILGFISREIVSHITCICQIAGNF